MDHPKFKDQNLLLQAFTHRSYLNETRETLESNERLEFLGDSILSYVVSKNLFAKYPEFNEGSLTNLRSLLVNTKSLAMCARELGFGTLLRLSKGEEESKGRENESLLADSYEAFIGALFMDQSISAVEKFIDETLLSKTADIIEKKSLKDPKSLLQEYVQGQRLNSPLYKVLKEEGPAHAKQFTIGVYVSNSLLGLGHGKSKQEGEEVAAKEALKYITVGKTLADLQSIEQKVLKTIRLTKLDLTKELIDQAKTLEKKAK